ncbi:MAG TPA: hypothetical protein VFR24_06310 [Candidatus Angelobacter sp.]|nr:hypothetical protein [Candidatus Angelobacter sp.]
MIIKPQAYTRLACLSVRKTGLNGHPEQPKDEKNNYRGNYFPQHVAGL